MNKYALGTVLATTLLGLAKSKMGSGVRVKAGYKQRFTGSIIFGLEEDVTVFDDNTMSKIRKTIESYGVIILGIEFPQQYQDDIDYTYSSVHIYIYKDYYSESSIFPLDNEDKFSTLLHNLKDEIENVISMERDDYLDSVGYDDVSSSNAISKNLYVQNQSGEWVPYEAPENTRTKLRKR